MKETLALPLSDHRFVSPPLPQADCETQPSTLLDAGPAIQAAVSPALQPDVADTGWTL